MDLQSQEAIQRLAEEHDPANLLVILGAPDPESAGMTAQTVVTGDPSYAGPLAEVQLGLDVYHVLDDAFRSAVPEDVFEEQVGVMTDVLDAEGITKAVEEARQQQPA